jgi:hypothetical protein
MDTSVVKQLDSVESTKWICVERISLNEFIQMRGMTFMPDKSKPDIDRESDAKTYTGVNCLHRRNFKMGDTLTLHDLFDILILMLTYIYSIQAYPVKET